MTILTIDVGNTTISLGVFEKQTCRTHWRIRTDRLQTPDEIGLKLRQLFQIHAALPPTHAIISSVVPRVTTTLQAAIPMYFAINPIILSYQSDFGLEIEYETPTTLGVDRLVNCFAAAEIYGGDCLVIDMGTATTFDLVTADRRYKGGIILAGPEMIAENLSQRTAQLFATDFSTPPQVIGVSTTTCIQSGLIYGTVAQIDGLIDRVTREWGRPLRRIVTGGYTDFIARLSIRVEIAEPMLTHFGLEKMAQRLISG